MNNYGKKIKQAREFLGLTQEQVAKVLKMNRNSIINIENGTRSLKVEELSKFSKLLGVSVDEIVSEEIKVDKKVMTFARGFDKLSPRDQEEIINLINFKNNYKG